jgi:hypothetical protein
MPETRVESTAWLLVVGAIAFCGLAIGLLSNCPTPEQDAVTAQTAFASEAHSMDEAILPGSSPPLLLVYGFQPLPGFHPPDLWADVIEALGGIAKGAVEHRLGFDHVVYAVPGRPAARRAIYVSDYALALEPTVRDLHFYADRLSEEIAWVCRREETDRADVVAFSMGALVARAYIESADFPPAALPSGGRTYRDDVRTLVTIAAPHHGAAFAALGPWFGPLPDQLDPESAFFAALNAGESEGTALHPNVRYISLAGQSCLGFGCSIRTDVEACRRECVEEALDWAGHDLVILMSSARLTGAENVACIGLDHVDMRTHEVILATLEPILDGAETPHALYADEDLRAAAP